MRIGKYEVFNTRTFILPKSEAAKFSVPLKSPHEGEFLVVVRWHDDDPEQEVEKGKIGTRWRVKTDSDGQTVVNVSFVNLKAPLGAAMGDFAQLGKIDDLPFGFMTFFQTYGSDSASFTIQFMMEVGDE